MIYLSLKNWKTLRSSKFLNLLIDKKELLRIHYQINQRQSKIVRVLNGSIYDVFVNIDKNQEILVNMVLHI